jgi:MOSC domain-containing protein YiiM
VTAVVVALGLAERAGAPLQPREALDLAPGAGVAGDRYALGRGHWQAWPDREVTLVAAEAAQRVGVDPLLLRRNVVTRGAYLDALVGAAFRLGEATLAGVRPCEPCAYLEELLSRPGLKAALAGAGGLRARVVAPGCVRVGDALVPERAPPPPQR